MSDWFNENFREADFYVNNHDGEVIGETVGLLACRRCGVMTDYQGAVDHALYAHGVRHE